MFFLFYDVFLKDAKRSLRLPAKLKNNCFTYKKHNTMKKQTWKFIVQTAIAILTAIATTLGVTSCMAAI